MLLLLLLLLLSLLLLFGNRIRDMSGDAGWDILRMLMALGTKSGFEFLAHLKSLDLEDCRTWNIIRYPEQRDYLTSGQRVEDREQ